MESLFRIRGSGISSDIESTIVPQFLSEIDGVESIENVIVIGASNRQDLIDPAVLRAGRLDAKIRIDRPDEGAAKEIFSKYLTPDLPFASDELEEVGEDPEKLIARIIELAVADMYSTKRENQFLRVTYKNKEQEILYFKDFASGAMIEAIVARAKTCALKRLIQTGERGIKKDDILKAIRDEYKENEDLPNTTNPDDWTKIAGRKGERIIAVESMLPGRFRKGEKDIEEIRVNGRYL
jgi:proteasome-associated ATPase